jgi:Sterol carrier protein domain
MNGVLTWSGPDPDPAGLFVLSDRHVQLVDRMHWMLRLVDRRAALAARPYPRGVAGRVAFRVADPVRPWNAGSWRLEVEGGEGRDDLVRVGLLAGFPPDGLELLRGAFASPRPWTRRGLLSGAGARAQQGLGDLDGVERRALAEVVGHRPEQHGVGVDQVGADAADQDAVGAG